MDRDRFNRDMGSYIRDRREKQEDKGNIKINIVRNRTSSEEIPDMSDDEIVVFDRPEERGENFLDRLLSFFVSGYEEVEEEPREELSPGEMKRLAKMQETKVEEEDIEEPDIEDLDVPEPNFIEKLFSFMGFGDKAMEDDFHDMDEFDPDDYAIEESNRVMFEEDVKNIIKIAHKWIEELPADKKKEFKQSGDFEEYKQLLDKLGLLK